MIFLCLHPLQAELYYLPVVFRRALQIASLVGVATLSLLYPLLESLDPWDSPEPSSDAEIQLIALLTFAGVMFVLAHVLATLSISFILTQVVRRLRQQASSWFTVFCFTIAPLATASPPAPLRI